MIKVLTTDHELKEALAVVWQVFTQFEAPEYSIEGVQEFKEYVAFDAMQQRIKAKELKLWSYHQDEKIVGVIGVRLPAHISLLFVESAYHRQGIARKLYQTALSTIGEPAVTVNSSPYALSVYQRLGFEETSEEQVVNGIRFIPMKYSVKKQGLE